MQRRHDRPRDLVGNGEDVGQRAVIGLAPELRAAAGVDQPHGDAHAVAEALQTALYEIADAEPPPDLGDVRRLLRYGRRRMAIDHEQQAKAAEAGDDVFGDAVAEMAEVGVAAEIAEGQDRNRRADQARARPRTRVRARKGDR